VKLVTGQTPPDGHTPDELRPPVIELTRFWLSYAIDHSLPRGFFTVDSRPEPL